MCVCLKISARNGVRSTAAGLRTWLTDSVEVGLAQILQGNEALGTGPEDDQTDNDGAGRHGQTQERVHQQQIAGLETVRLALQSLKQSNNDGLFLVTSSNISTKLARANQRSVSVFHVPSKRAACTRRRMRLRRTAGSCGSSSSAGRKNQSRAAGRCSACPSLSPAFEGHR